MKTILLVGKYFPSFSVEAVQLHYLAMDLKKTGYRIILVSDAWCNTEREAFIGDAQDLGDESVFDRKYYLDPLQESVMGQKASRGILLYGLCCEVIRSENITSVLLMDLLPYGYMSTLLKDEFPTLKVYLYLGASSWFTSLFEPYGKACFLQMLRSLTAVLCYPEAYQVLKRILETPMLFCVYPFGPHLKECCHAFPSETYALGWADSIREQKFVSKMVAECPTDTKFFLTGKHAMDLKTENLYLEGIPINRCLKMMEAKQTIILINTFSHIYYPTAYLTLSLLGNVVVTHEDYFEALDKCECYRIRAYPEMPNAIGFYIDANEKCITTIAEFFQIEDNNE
jgi:hypothetical protein